MTVSKDEWDRIRRETDAERILFHVDQYNGDGPSDDELPPPPLDVLVVGLEEFIAVDEPGAAALLGTEDAALIPEGGDVMIYGDGGAGKTTLAIDLACHLATGETWLEIPVPRPVRVMMIENEGPRPLLRKKLKRKHEAWTGPPLNDQVRIFDSPWGKFTFATVEWREELALKIAGQEVDVLIAGPLTRIGMKTAGTLQEVAAFMRLVADVRERSQRPLTVIVIHHENKSGAVSGAWEGSGDTLLHVQPAGNGHTVVFVQKARWSSEHTHTSLKLAWTAGEGFKLNDDRDVHAELDGLLEDDEPRTVKEMAAALKVGEDAIKVVIADNPADYYQLTSEEAKDAGRHPTAKLYRIAQMRLP